jgi:hypothetical protein
MMRRIAAIFFLALISILPGNLHAQELTASASSTTVAVGEQFQLTFTVNANGRNFHAPSMPDFNVLVGPNQSTSMQIINGSVSQSLSFTYVIQAVKEGKFTIGPAEIYVGNTKLVSNQLTITVAKGGSNKQGGQTSNGVDGGKNVFIKVSIDKSNAFLGEGVSVTYKLYTKVDLVNYSNNKLPSFSGFWSQEVPMSQQLEFRTENLDGVTYRVADIKKVILFPQRSGVLSIDPMEAEVIARVRIKNQRSNDPFDQMFSDPFGNNPFFSNVQNVRVPLKSDPVKITVRDLPNGAPPGFSGAVGKFTYEASLDKKETNAHDAVNLRIKISGKGNIKLIDVPKIDFPPDFETYDPKENVTANATSAGVTGTKTFEYLLIPRNAGNFKIPIQPFSYFDLERRQYVQIPASDINLKVGKGSESTTTTVVSGVNRTEVQMLGKDIRFIKTRDPKFESNSGPLFNSPLFYSLTLSPALFFIGLIVVRRRNESMAGNARQIKSQRANKVAMKRLSEAKKFMQANERERFLDEMFKALWGFISDKLQIPVSDLSKESAAKALHDRNVPDGIILQFNDTVDACEFARFAGGMAESNDSIYRKGIETITLLENNLA